MKTQDKTNNKKFSARFYRINLSVCAVIINVLFSFIMYKLGLPLYFDTIGTVIVAALTGLLFPAICTSVITSVICSFFYWPAIYLSFINAFIAFITVFFVRNQKFRKFNRAFLHALVTTFISAAAVSILQYILYGKNDVSLIAKNAMDFSSASATPYLLSFGITNLVFYFLEKGSICIIVMLLFTCVPKSFLSLFDETGNRRLITDTVRQYINENHRNLKHPLHKKITLTFIISSVILVSLTGAISLRLYFDNTKKEKTRNAKNCVKFAAECIDASKIDDFIKYGMDAPGYKETLDILSKILNFNDDVSYLYVLKIEENGCRFILDTDLENPYSPGELVPFDNEFEKYLPLLFEGKEIDPVESDNILGWLLTVYQPVLNSEGKTVCYVGADVAMRYVAGYMGRFILKVLLIMAGFFIVIIAYTIWTIGNNMSYPISAVAACIDHFSDSSEDQEKLEDNVRLIRSLNIKSGDEIQKLYDAICHMTLNQTEQIRNIRRLSDSTVTMQDGLIITMADMVENRDSDTGAHVQKTSAYVKIIVEGLKKKGYYPQKISPKFISDVVRSAPLHDVGKINISDTILNKPGKLTDEEFAIMKTHTTAGKEILEKVISTVQGESYLKEARNMAAYHHERWDGKGYPEGLHGEVIPLSARIMAVADVFDALASPRVYKPAFPLEKALAILQEGSGTQFDPKCVEVFMDSLSEVKMVLKKYHGGNFAT